MPVITLVQSPSNFAQSQGRIFSNSTIELSYRVDYCGDAATAGTLFAVMDDMRDAGVQLFIGRPLKIFPSDGGGANNYASAYDASQTTTEIALGKVPFVTRFYDGHLVPGSSTVWHVRISLSLLCNGTLFDQLHCTVQTNTSSRTAAAYRVDSGRASIANSLKYIFSGSSPELGTPEGFATLYSCAAAGGNAKTGKYDPDNWRTGLKTTMDVSGNPIDVHGQAISIRLEQINHTLSFVIRRPYLGDVPGTPGTPTGYGTRTKNCLWTLWGQNSEWCLNKRNADAMFGYPAGSLVCTAVNLMEIDEDYMKCDVTLSFDEWGHCDQVPWTLEGTTPPSFEDVAGTDRPILNADTVFWANPHQEAFKWNGNDFPDGALQLFEDMILNVV
jgi:hypothetical protein